MLQFARFLIEAEHKMKLDSPNVDVNHVEDAVLRHGHEGVHQSAEFMDKTHDMLSGHKSTLQHTAKFDGSPPLVFGLHPVTGKFFVSSPQGQSKVNHTPEDIVNNHANNPKLAAQLITSLSELPKILPKNAQPGEVFQGDFMHSPDSILDKDGHHHIKPNKLVYSAKEGSPHGSAMKNSKMGLVIHTAFAPNGVAMPVDKKTRGRFVNHPDVHNIDPTFTPEDGKYEPADMNEFIKHRDAATKHYRSMQPESLDAVATHAPDILRHINDKIKAGEPYDSKSLIASLNISHKKRMDGIKNEKWGKQQTSEHASKTAHLLANETHVDKALKLHKHVMDAKDVLAKVMDRSNPWIHSLNGEITPSEGHVAVDPKTGSAAKFVQRKEFAKATKKASKKKNDK